MRNGLTFIGLLVVVIGWMSLILGLLPGGLLDALPALLGAVHASPSHGTSTVFALANGTLLTGPLLTGGGLWLGTREQPLRRARPPEVPRVGAYRLKPIVHMEPLEDGRTKYFYEGGETEIY